MPDLFINMLEDSLLISCLLREQGGGGVLVVSENIFSESFLSNVQRNLETMDPVQIVGNICIFFLFRTKY